MLLRKLIRLWHGTWAILYNFVLCYFFDRSRRVAFVNSVLSFHERQRLAEGFPSIEFTDLFPELHALALKFKDFSYRGGNVSFGELAILTTIVRSMSPRTIFEFGTYDGNTTLQLALNAPSDAIVYTIDLPANDQKTRLRIDPGDRSLLRTVTPGERFIGSSVERKIQQILADSAIYDYSPLKRKVEFIFIDGSHSYEYLQNDTERALEMLAPGGIVLWHDYMVWNDVTDYLNQLSRRLPLKHIKGTSLVAYIQAR